MQQMFQMLIGLLFFLQLPLVIASLVLSLWGGAKMRAGESETGRMMLVGSFVCSAVLTISYLGECILGLRAGQTPVISLLFAALWGYYAVRGYKSLWPS